MMRNRLFQLLLALLITILIIFCGVSYAEPTANGFRNPLVRSLADPCIMVYDGVYYMSGTGDNIDYDLYTSTDLIHWIKEPIKIFSPYGKTNVWAPDLFYSPDDGKFYLYYTVNNQIGVACSDTPDGIYTDLGILIKDAIDAHMFRDDDGSLYLYYSWKTTIICVQPMSSPTKMEGKPVKLLHSGFGWDNPRNEAPWVIKHENTYYLIFSGNDANLSAYGEGYATSDKPTGPFVKYAKNPVIQANDNVFGPGSGCVVRDEEGTYWHIYHQKDLPGKGWDRSVCMDKLWFDDDGVLHCQATRGINQPRPLISPPSSD